MRLLFRLSSIAFAIAWLGPAHADGCVLDRGPERTVARVIDAETVLLDDGGRVRLTSILAPRARDAGVADGRWPPEQAAIKALEDLVLAKPVRLQFDRVRQDRHGHWLAHLQPLPGPEAPSVQQALVASGHARVDAIEGQRSCVASLIDIEAQAQAEARGLWTEPAYRVRTATPARDIAAFRGTFQIVTGRIVRVDTGRDATRLILGDDRRRDLTLAIRNNDRDVAGALGGDLKQLAGRDVEARGWVIQRTSGGPEIDVSLAGHVRLIDGGGTPAVAASGRTPRRRAEP